jgi:acyl phosphate:glycerol-3-phosphate acyltransferase
MIGSLVVLLIATYFFAAIPFGFIVGKAFAGIDIREHGSKNVGATNVWRVLGKPAGIATLILDMLKGVLPVYIAIKFFPSTQDPLHLIPALTSCMAVIAHSKSIYIGFSGGKSVGTGLGTYLVMQPLASVITIVLSVGCILLTRYVSVGSILGAILIPVLFSVFGAPPSYIILSSLICIYVTFKHKANIQRLIRGEENRI